jgi:hypothetical protein
MPVPVVSGSPNSFIFLMDSDEIALIRGWSLTQRIAKDHERSARCCGLKSAMLGMDCEEREANSGQSG